MRYVSVYDLAAMAFFPAVKPRLANVFGEEMVGQYQPLPHCEWAEIKVSKYLNHVALQTTFPAWQLPNSPCYMKSKELKYLYPSKTMAWNYSMIVDKS